MQKLITPPPSQADAKSDSIINRLIGWMIDNPIAVNLLTVAILAMGLYSFANIKQETSPLIQSR